MNKVLGIIIVIIIIVGGIYLATKARKSTDMNSNVTTQTGEQQNTEQATKSTSTTKSATKVAGVKGHVVFSIADAAADINSVSEINIKISKLDMHSNASGWVTVFATPKTYDLLKLKTISQSRLIADFGAKAGTYDQVRMNIDSVSITTKAGAVREAKIPAKELKIAMKIIVDANKVSSVNFDFLADKSLHTTANGEFIFAPVVVAQATSGASIQIDTSDNNVEVIGGDVDSGTTVGMDIDGSVRVNFQIDSNQTLIIDDKGAIKVQGILQ